MDLASDQKFARELAEKVGRHRMGIGLKSLRIGNLYDTGIWIFDDIGTGTGPFFSPRVFEKVYLPVYKKNDFFFQKSWS